MSPDLAGALWLRPGQPAPHNLRSSRPDVLARITLGLPAQRLAPTLSSLFSLCGAAHALCAGLAVAAALGGAAAPTAADRRQLQWLTLREHLRHLWLHVPQGLALAGSPPAPSSPPSPSTTPAARASAASMALLATCPLWAATPAALQAGPTSAAAQAGLAATAAWLHTHLFGRPAAAWLAAWSRQPAATLQHWARTAPAGVPAGLLRALGAAGGAGLMDGRVDSPMDVQTGSQMDGQMDGQMDSQMDSQGTAVGNRPHSRVPALQVHASAAALRTLADALLASPAMASQPCWQHACAETGAWTRLHLPGAPAGHSLALRLGARLAEIARLVLPCQVGNARSPANGCNPSNPDRPHHQIGGGPHGAGWLAVGVLPLGPGRAIAWAETARGLLLHQVVLRGTGSAATVACCQVIAPTDWNFHPAGAVAQALATLPATATATAVEPATAPAAHRKLKLLLAAYDACVPCHIVPAAAAGSAATTTTAPGLHHA